MSPASVQATHIWCFIFHTITISINCNRITALERSVINYLGLKLLSRWSKQRPRFFCSPQTYIKSCSVRMKDVYSSKHRNSKHTNQNSTLRWNKMEQDESSIARPTLKRWSNRSFCLTPVGPNQNKSMGNFKSIQYTV